MKLSKTTSNNKVLNAYLNIRVINEFNRQYKQDNTIQIN